MISGSTFAGMRVAAGKTSAVCQRTSVKVMAAKRVPKKQQVVLRETIPGLGQAGELVTVLNGFMRNHLLPTGKAEIATPEILEQVRAEAEQIAKQRAEEKKVAQKLATALKTIGKFTIKKKVGEGEKIFGTVTAEEICETVYNQTSQQLDKRGMSVPAISSLGTYDITIKLHPEVTAAFQVVVAKDTAAE
ncbi:unnamed protein product [Pedinophyceae sp. YPF-701]|nr:unnamed protein product [Pedinophyceae sp. YPF-701]